VHVHVRLFAGLREHAGLSEATLELPDGAVVGDILTAMPEFADTRAGMAFAVNRAYADSGQALTDGDEVALIPPVSGGVGDVWLTTQPIDLDALVARVADDEAGAIATFTGTTRVHSRGRTVIYLDYEAYEGMAEQELQRICDHLTGEHDLCGIAICHRIGRVDIGETSVAIAAAAPHRAAAFDACREAIDTLKQTVPLWKKEVYEGGEEWIGKGS
jgi:molybdopterin synthase catalytic subunit